MTVRASILTDLEGSLAAITAINQVEAGKWLDFDLKAVTLPIAFVTLQDDDPAEGAMGFETFWVNAVVEVWCADEDLETLIGAVHAAIMADVTQGGNSLNTKRTSCVPFSLDPVRGLTGFAMTFRILYRHQFGSP
jgi:hypothetical protein